MTNIFYSDERPLHQAIALAFGKSLIVVNARDELDAALSSHKGGLVIIDADYIAASGYAICEDIKSQYDDAFRVHLLSNEASVGEAEKAEYAGVDRLFIVPLELEDLLSS